MKIYFITIKKNNKTLYFNGLRPYVNLVKNFEMAYQTDSYCLIIDIMNQLEGDFKVKYIDLTKDMLRSL